MKHKNQTITFLLLVTLSILAPLKAQDAKSAATISTPVRFAIIGDRTGDHMPGIYEQIVVEVERMKPDFILTVGDMIEGYTADTNRLNQQWSEYKTIISKLSMPIYFTPGNHDITTDAALGTYQKQIGKPYYSFDISGIHFIILDNSRWDSSKDLPKEQLDWLAADLKQSAYAAYTFVLFHKPFWYNTISQGKPDTLHSLFRAYGVDGVFSGHFHEYFSGKYDGILYTCVGSSGGNCDPGPTGLQYHFIWVTADAKGISIAPIKMGSVLPWDEVTASDERLASTIRLKAISFESPLPLDTKLSLINNALSVVLKNISPDVPMTDTIRWDIPAGWTVAPQEYPATINPNDSLIAKFSFNCSGWLYPVPTIITHFPLAPGKRPEVKKPISISREAICLKASAKPKIDGKIDEPVWSNPDTKLFSPDGDSMTADSSYFYFLYDDNSLYLASCCKESKMDSLSARLTGQDAPIYGEDCVGYFLQPDIKKQEVYQIYFGPLGSVFDQKITPSDDGYMTGNPKWNGKYEVKAFKGNNYWSMEARIPLAQLGAKIKPGQEWGLNFRRKQARLATSANWQVPIDYDPSTFGRLVFK